MSNQTCPSGQLSWSSKGTLSPRPGSKFSRPQQTGTSHADGKALHLALKSLALYCVNRRFRSRWCCHVLVTSCTVLVLYAWHIVSGSVVHTTTLDVFGDGLAVDGQTTATRSRPAADGTGLLLEQKKVVCLCPLPPRLVNHSFPSNLKRGAHRRRRISYASPRALQDVNESKIHKVNRTT